MTNSNAHQVIIEPAIARGSDLLLVLLVACILATLYSGLVIKAALGRSSGYKDDRAGWVMGKAENIIIILLCVAGELTGLAILISAKAIIRRSEESEDTSYRVAGTLVNLAWSLLIGLAARTLIHGI